MASTEQQAAWLSQDVGVYVTHDAVVDLSGEDSASWLNGQVTVDVRELARDRATYALATTVKGRVLTDLWALASDTGLAVVLPACCREQALEVFEKHIIMEDVELLPRTELCVVSLQGPKAATLLAQLAPATFRYACARLPPQPGYDVWVPETQREALVSALTAQAQALGGGRVDDAGWAHAHVLLGVPRVGIDFGVQSYPQEAGLKARAVSFNKGCYTGQEVVYMLEKRGQVSRRLVQLVGPATALANGEPVYDESGARLGEVTSAVREESRGISLAYVKRAAARTGARVQILGSPWEVCCVLGEHAEGCPIVAST